MTLRSTGRAAAPAALTALLVALFGLSAMAPSLGAAPVHTGRAVRDVIAAVRAARAHEPIPRDLLPTSPNGDPASAFIPLRCVPRFGPGSTFQICPLGDRRSRRIVALVGDSHAWMWIPGLERAAGALHVELVPLTKPGCLLSAVFHNRRGWPCLTWYRRVERILRRLRPTATLVSFMTSNLSAHRAATAINDLARVLESVPHPILIADPPNYNDAISTVAPSACLSAAGANLGTCARPQPPQMRTVEASIHQMTSRAGVPIIATLAWFCADRLCPTVIGRTVTSEDGSHLTLQYSRALAPALSGALRPVLDARRSGRAGR